MDKRKIALIALLSCFFVGLGFAAYRIVSNIIHIEAPVQPVPLAQPILIDVYGFPTSITVNQTYTFQVRTRNIDPNYAYHNLTTVIALRFKNESGTWLTLTPSMFYIHYKDPNWEGDIQNLFEWNGTHLVCTALGGGKWNAPIGYDLTAQITFKILPESNLPKGTLVVDCYVTKQT
jgi:hypothetical protein